MKHLIFKTFGILSVSLILSSCLKEKGYTDVIHDTNPKVVAFAVPAGVQSQSLKSQAAPQSFDVMIGLTTAGRSGDVTVTLAQDATLATTGFTSYPSSNVTITPSSVTFGPKDEYKTVKVTVTNTNTIDPCTKYMIPIRLTPNNGAIAASNQMALISIPIANPYSGSATATGIFNHPTAGIRTFTDLPKTLATVDCRTVKTALGDLGGNSSYQLGIRVNSDNTLTLSNMGDGTGAPVTQNNNATSNRYNPTTRTFDLSYQYDPGSGPRVVTETIKLQ